LAEIVGLEHVTRFATASSEASKTLKSELRRLEAATVDLRHRRTKIADDLAVARSAADSPRPRFDELVHATCRDLPTGIGTRLLPSELEDIAALGREVAAALELARNVGTSFDRLEQARLNQTESIDQIEVGLAALLERADEAVRRAPAQIQMAGAALELLGDTCPVCGQSIEEASVRDHLDELLRAARADADAAAEARQAVADAQARLMTARTAEAQQRSAAEELERDVREFKSQATSNEWIALADEWLSAARSAQLVSDLANWQRRLRQAYTEARRVMSVEVV
jgi:DNA repair exonuclease SbcCD ATPase subunit